MTTVAVSPAMPTVEIALSTSSADGAETLYAEIGEERHSRRLDRATIEGLLAELDTVMSRATRWGDEDQGSAAVVRRSCELLFDLVFPTAVKTTLRELAGGRLALCIRGSEGAAWLESLPFELMHDGRGLLGERFGLARRGIGVPVKVEAAAAGRALVVCDPRGDLIGAYHEGLSVRDELSALGYSVDLRSTEVTALDVLRLLRDYELVHFAGHGERPGYERGGPARGWWLKDDVLTAGMLTELAGGRPLPALVFSNACRSLALDGEAGLAAAMLRGGARHVIGTTREVPDEVAALFALAFFELLRGGVPIGDAVRQARLNLRERYGPSSVYGGAWVLYGDPNEVISPGVLLEEEPVLAPAVHEVGQRLRGGGETLTVDAFLTAPIGATRGQTVLASIGAVAVVAMLVALVVLALTRSNETQVTPVRTADPHAGIVRAHPIEYWPAQPLWGPPSAP